MWKFLKRLFALQVQGPAASPHREQPQPVFPAPRVEGLQREVSPPAPPEELDQALAPEPVSPARSYAEKRRRADDAWVNEMRAILEGRASYTPPSIDYGECEDTAAYNEAVRMVKAGEVGEAVQVLEKLLSTPSIYRLNYELLFKLYRQANRDDLKAGRHKAVRARVWDMIRLDEEMTGAMLTYWSEVHGRKLGPRHFDAYKNLKVSDARALRVAAEALKDRKAAIVATRLIERFGRARDKAKASRAPKVEPMSIKQA